MKSILITRPLPEASATAAEVERLGFQPFVAPLMTIEILEAAWPEVDTFDAIALTSARAVVAMPEEWKANKPVFAVGAHTAEAAFAAGFSDVRSADSDAAALARLLDAELESSARVFHPHGAEFRRLEGRFKYRPLEVYRTLPITELPPEAEAFFASPDAEAVLFYSPRGGAVFAALARSRRLDRVRALCLSEAVLSSIAALDWAEKLCAARPDNAAIMDLVRGL